MENTIEVKNLVKSYKLYEKPSDRLKEALRKGSCYHKDFLAVNDISFSVKKGETVGIIGRNGAGKSTLLKMITGVLKPSSGDIKLSGNVAALLELGAGFDAERNGIENIYLNGRINGMSKKEIDESLDKVLEFADIGDFVYQPIKTYSSGMLVRLAFAAAVNVNPEILIVDEALSVGDVRFQQKCYRKIREFKKNGTVLFVSHDTGAISSFCDRVIWLDGGTIYKEGEPGEIIEEYLSFMRYEIKKDESAEDEETEVAENADNTFKSGFGTNDAFFTKISLKDATGKTVSQIVPGHDIIFDMVISTKKKIEDPIIGFNIKDTLGNELVVSNNIFEKVKLPPFEANKRYHYQWKLKFPYLHMGDYPVDMALANGTYAVHEQMHFVTDAIIVKVTDERLYQEGRGKIVPHNIKLVSVED